MKHDKIVFDKTELMVVDESGKRPELRDITYDKITSVAFDKCKEGLFRKDSEKISMTVSGLGKPIEFFKGKEKDKFDFYKENLAAFCKENKVSLYDSTKK